MQVEVKNSIKYFEKRKVDLEEELASINTALEFLKKSDHQIDFSDFEIVKQANRKATKIPEAYNSNLKYPSQIMWTLKKFGSQTINDMVDIIDLLYGVENKEKLFKGFTYSASILHKKGELNAERVGKANRYSLKKPDTIQL